MSHLKFLSPIAKNAVYNPALMHSRFARQRPKRPDSAGKRMNAGRLKTQENLVLPASLAISIHVSRQKNT
jgi:hypothetical protein